MEVYNTGESDLIISNLEINGTDSSHFTIGSNSCIGASKIPGELCFINISFSPYFTGTKTANLTIYTNVGNFDVPLSGNAGNCVSILGDINNNNSISAFDGAMVLQAVVGSINLTNEQKCAADVNENSSISAYDSALLLKCVVGNCSGLPQNFLTSCTNHGNCL